MPNRIDDPSAIRALLILLGPLRRAQSIARHPELAEYLTTDTESEEAS